MQSNWEKLYKIAVFQTDSQQLWKAITEAERAVEERLNECPPPLMEQTEVQAISKTLMALSMLKSQARASEARQPSNGHYPAAKHDKEQQQSASAT